ncbi:Dihydrodipicolinate synthase family [Pseudomonas sp. R5-89-07]|nr:Dihydrodipicolinate synthase family [Pseudomonas sp. R5-89-07]
MFTGLSAFPLTPMALRSDLANSQFDLPSAHGRIKFSIWLLSMAPLEPIAAMLVAYRGAA